MEGVVGFVGLLGIEPSCFRTGLQPGDSPFVIRPMCYYIWLLKNGLSERGVSLL